MQIILLYVHTYLLKFSHSDIRNIYTPERQYGYTYIKYIHIYTCKKIKIKLK